MRKVIQTILVFVGVFAFSAIVAHAQVYPANYFGGQNGYSYGSGSIYSSFMYGPQYGYGLGMQQPFGYNQARGACCLNYAYQPSYFVQQYQPFYYGTNSYMGDYGPGYGGYTQPWGYNGYGNQGYLNLGIGLGW